MQRVTTSEHLATGEAVALSMRGQVMLVKCLLAVIPKSHVAGPTTIVLFNNVISFIIFVRKQLLTDTTSNMIFFIVSTELVVVALKLVAEVTVAVHVNFVFLQVSLFLE